MRRNYDYHLWTKKLLVDKGMHDKGRHDKGRYDKGRYDKEDTGVLLMNIVVCDTTYISVSLHIPTTLYSELLG